METNNVTEHNMVNNPNWQEADQLAICKCGRGVELGSTGALTTWPCCLLKDNDQSDHGTCTVHQMNQ